MNIYLLSDRALYSSVSYDPLFELEDILVETCGAKLLIPTQSPAAQWANEQPKFASKFINKVVRRTTGSYQLEDEALASIKKPNVLLIVALCGANLATLSSISNWRDKFDVVAAYIFDAWGFHIYPKYTSQLDRLFVPMPELIEGLKQSFGIPVSSLPFGVDALTHGSSGVNRPIDLISYGRIPKQYHTAFNKKFNQPGSGRIYYRSTPRAGESYPKIPYQERRDREDRMLLFKILRRTKLCLAFDTLYPGMREFPHSFVTLRWFEGGAAGCAIVGKRPITPVAEQLLNWEDATIELPDDPEASVKLIEELLQDEPRLHAIHKRNYIENLTRHDWRWRIKSMLEELKIPLPVRLAEELSQMLVVSR
ncbi:glycosyltransferase [Kamptonema sp. UHCC 0994]|uniref:glycosyltransferase n=1 Tax=Kamptonema sp. UHCC 0994 TaxID=3031329 RepID=UPI0023B9E8C0|nr:glycosyltransferase [Kamptonema sp. UHCC 0994]MDF0554983.1 glycosyltransferase [Kamptonema sp. UHCC 0994]